MRGAAGSGPGRCGEAQPARRARALRRLSARRSSSDSPPQTPASCPVSSAQCRQVSMTSQRRQTALASSICSRAGPGVPDGEEQLRVLVKARCAVAPVHEVVHSSALEGRSVDNGHHRCPAYVGGTRGHPRWGRASPAGTPRCVPRSSNDKPHILVPAFTRDCPYKFVTWKRLRSRYVTERDGDTKRYLPEQSVKVLAEIHRTLDVLLSVVPPNARRAGVVPRTGRPHA